MDNRGGSSNGFRGGRGGGGSGGGQRGGGGGGGQRGGGGGRGRRRPRPSGDGSSPTPEEHQAPKRSRGRGGGGSGSGGRGGGRGGSAAGASSTAPPPSSTSMDVEMAGPSSAPIPEGSSLAEFITDVPFSSVAGLSPLTLRALNEQFKFRTMTVVQRDAMPVALAGHDVIARARTGTGKTVAFLVPAIERLMRLGRPTRHMSILVLSPTRELASQITNEAKGLLHFHPGFEAHCIVGGTNIKGDQKMFARNSCSVLVATPGRLQDHIDNTPGFKAKLLALDTLVLDEADRLLDMGFRPAIERILRDLPPSATRQTLLFSATVSDEVRHIARMALKPKHEYVDSVGDDVGTHEHVEQHCYSMSPDRLFPALHRAICTHRATVPNYKIICFFVTARLTQWCAAAFNRADLPVLEIHSRKSQGVRTKTSDTFRQSSNLILFSSDVSARGVDYPNVSLVIQVGMPANREQYVHRLGRTARAGRTGAGLLLLASFEQPFLRSLSDLPVTIHPTGEEPATDDPAAVMQADTTFARGASAVDAQTGGQAYQSWMGFYNSSLRLLHWDKVALVAHANEFALRSLHLAAIPALEARTVGKMGIRGTPGLVVNKGPSGGGGGGGGRGFGAGRGGGGPSGARK